MSAAPAWALFDRMLSTARPTSRARGNDMRRHRGLPRAAVGPGPMVGSGARGMVGIALNVTPEDAAFPALRDEFLEPLRGSPDARKPRPRPRCCRARRARRGADPLGHRHQQDRTLHTAAGGERSLRAPSSSAATARRTRKVHPAPLLEAARRAGVAAEDCIYVGDDSARCAGRPRGRYAHDCRHRIGGANPFGHVAGRLGGRHARTTLAIPRDALNDVSPGADTQTSTRVRSWNRACREHQFS